ncbi:MAG TPA: phasin family protein [Xanthobacteraceae bacterium]|jgi:hypothetical protein|nr:phasin family protein [Xanthobacteraceae bacterium]
MIGNFEQVQKLGKDNFEVALKSLSAASQGVQAIAVEAADYSKKSYEQGTQALEKLLGAKSLEKAVEAQSDYLRSTYEQFVAQATKLSELYADLAKKTYEPFENYLGKAAAAK